MIIQKILNEEIVPRYCYLDKIKDYLNTPLIKVLIGQRRVGKSTILKSVLQELYNQKNISLHNIFYINKELYDFDHINTYTDLQQSFQSFLTTTQDGKIFV
jgi:predicted AAA+ superfamily ATPase